jgi:hypothetical protein
MSLYSRIPSLYMASESPSPQISLSLERNPYSPNRGRQRIDLPNEPCVPLARFLLGIDCVLVVLESALCKIIRHLVIYSAAIHSQFTVSQENFASYLHPRMGQCPLAFAYYNKGSALPPMSQRPARYDRFHHIMNCSTLYRPAAHRKHASHAVTHCSPKQPVIDSCNTP